jgi:hypothetical protein
MDRYRSRGRDWPDLVARFDLQVGSRDQRRNALGRDVAAYKVRHKSGYAQRLGCDAQQIHLGGAAFAAAPERSA